MSRISLKSKDSNEFKTYVEIGKAYSGFPEEFYALLPGYAGIEQGNWLKLFQDLSPGEQIDIINYIFKDSPESYPELANKLKPEEIRLNNFLQKYYDDALFEGGLDFYDLDKNDGWEIEDEIYDDDGNTLKMLFKEGSVVLFLDGFSYLKHSRYISEKKYAEIEEKLDFFVSLLLE